MRKETQHLKPQLCPRGGHCSHGFISAACAASCQRDRYRGGRRQTAAIKEMKRETPLSSVTSGSGLAIWTMGCGPCEFAGAPLPALPACSGAGPVSWVGPGRSERPSTLQPESRGVKAMDAIRGLPRQQVRRAGLTLTTVAPSQGASGKLFSLHRSLRRVSSSDPGPNSEIRNNSYTEGLDHKFPKLPFCGFLQRNETPTGFASPMCAHFSVGVQRYQCREVKIPPPRRILGILHPRQYSIKKACSSSVPREACRTDFAINRIESARSACFGSKTPTENIPRKFLMQPPNAAWEVSECTDLRGFAGNGLQVSRVLTLCRAHLQLSFTQ